METTTVTAKATLQLVTFDADRKVFVGQEATMSYGSDSYPAKVVEIRLAMPNPEHDPKNEESSPWRDLGFIHSGDDLLSLLSVMPAAR